VECGRHFFHLNNLKALSLYAIEGALIWRESGVRIDRSSLLN